MSEAVLSSGFCSRVCQKFPRFASFWNSRAGMFLTHSVRENVIEFFSWTAGASLAVRAASKLLPSRVAEISGISAVVKSMSGIGGGILGGYLGIALHGTGEKLWDSKEFADTYFFKSVCCILFFLLIDQFRDPEGGLLRSLIIDQMMGSLIYNHRDISNFIKQLWEGRVLKGILPDSLPRALSQAFSFFSAKTLLSSYLTAKVCGHVNPISELPKEIQKVFFESIGVTIQIPLDAANLPWDKLVRENIDQIIETGRPWALVLNHAGCYSLSHFFVSCNEYVSILKKEQLIMDKQKNYFASLSSKPQEVLRAEKMELKNHIHDLLDRSVRGFSEAKKAQLAAHALQTVNNIQMIHSFFGREKISFLEYPAILSPLLLLNFDDQTIEPYLETLSRSIIHSLHQAERKITGFAMSPMNNLSLVKELLDLHLHFIFLISIKNSATRFSEITKEEIQQFFIHFLSLLKINYRQLVGEKIAGFAHDIFYHQLINS